MVTIAPSQPTTIRYTATLESPMHHGAGSSGNTSILRTQEVVQPDGTIATVPFLSAASIRHALRDRIAWHLADTIGLAEGSLAKSAVDLLWSGGAVTKTGAETDLALARRVEEHFPALGLFGYAAQSDIVAGTLRASDMMLVCAENAWRLGAWEVDATRMEKRAAAFRAEEFGTRHDIATSPVARLIQTADALTGAATKTTQMIFDTQVLMSGSQLAGMIEVIPSGTPMHHVALGAALELWAPGGETAIGAKTASGYGRARITGLGDTTASLESWTTHVEEHADAILALIGDLSS